MLYKNIDDYVNYAETFTASSECIWFLDGIINIIRLQNSVL